MRIIFLLIFCSVLFGCSSDDGPQDEAVLHVWAHAGQESERKTLQDQVARFNQQHGDWRVELTFLPEASYNAQVQAAAIAGKLPDVLEFDGPFVYNYVWQGHLRPLDKLLPTETISDLLPSLIAQGTYQGKLYSVGTFDSGLGLYGSRRALTEAGIRIPGGIDDTWSRDDFAAALAALAKHDEDGAVLDLKFNYRGEWYTYAFSPILQSAGADLIDRGNYQQSRGSLDGAAAIDALTEIQRWITSGFVDPNIDDQAFVGGRVALSWVGHWEYPRYKQALGDDLVVLPLPNFGQGSKTGQGSWNWGVAQKHTDSKRAATFLAFLLQPEEVLRMAEVNGAVPGTRQAIAKSSLYRPGGPLALFVEQLQKIAVARPQTPAYPIITSAFQEAFDKIRSGGDVRAALTRAAKMIDRDIADNKGYSSP